LSTFTVVMVLNRVKDDLLRASRAESKESPTPKVLQLKKTNVTANSGVIVEDIGSCLIKFARCCTPVPGDPIVGFVTKGFGVSIHRCDCVNAHPELIGKQPDRWVKASWAIALADETFATSLELDVQDRDNMVLDIAAALSGMKIKVSEISGRSLPSGRGLIALTFSVRSVSELNNVCAKLRTVSGVEAVRRGKN